jgi:hypothetical protein
MHPYSYVRPICVDDPVPVRIAVTLSIFAASCSLAALLAAFAGAVDFALVMAALVIVVGLVVLAIARSFCA